LQTTGFTGRAVALLSKLSAASKPFTAQVSKTS
jgi:hypothetical protein